MIVERLNIIPLWGIADPVSSFLHFIGMPYIFLFTYYCLKITNITKKEFTALALFSVSNFLAFLMSTSYHMSPKGTELRIIFQQLDHATIWISIAGCISPFCFLLLHGSTRWIAVLSIWSIALLGVCLKFVFFSSIPEWLGSALYIAMGCYSIYFIKKIYDFYGFSFIDLVVVAGLLDVLGAIVDLSKLVVLPGVIEAHEIFHFMVFLAGVSFSILLRRVIKSHVSWHCSVEDKERLQKEILGQ